MITQAIADAVAAEREACAKVCEDLIRLGHVSMVQFEHNQAYARCKNAILARNDE